MRTRFGIQAIFSLLFLLCSTVTFSQTWSTLPVDLLVSMNTSTPGTALSPSIANAGTVSSQCSVGSNCNWTGVTDFIVGAYRGTMSNLGPIQMTGSGGALYPAQSLNFNNMAHDDANNNTNGYLTMNGAPAGATAVSATVEITLGPPYQNSTGSDWDIFGIWTAGGQYYEAQLNDECNARVNTVFALKMGIRRPTRPRVSRFFRNKATIFLCGQISRPGSLNSGSSLPMARL